MLRGREEGAQREERMSFEGRDLRAMVGKNDWKDGGRWGLVCERFGRGAGAIGEGNSEDEKLVEWMDLTTECD
jgi:hypothetical protein